MSNARSREDFTSRDFREFRTTRRDHRKLKVRSGRKNSYSIRFPKTNASGKAEIIREDFVGQFTDHWDFALMDYDGTIESASPVVEASLFDACASVEHRIEILAWPLLKHERTKRSSRQEEFEYRVSCRNAQFVARPVTVDLE